MGEMAARKVGPIDGLSRERIEDIIKFDEIVKRIRGWDPGWAYRMEFMKGIGKHPYFSRHSVLGIIALVALMAVCSIGLVQCGKASVDDGKPAQKVPRTIQLDGYAIQLFPTADEQLRHALRWYADIDEKKASFEAVRDAFPDARNAHAEAGLGLAYLALGRDYRLATAEQCRGAISRYKEILSEYADLAPICAKADWYIGWILADLLHEPGRAAGYFQKVVTNYPDATLNFKSAVPWVSLVLPQVEERTQAVYERPKYFWSSIALLELVRTSESEADRWSAFEKLFNDPRSRQATEFAIRALLRGSPSLRPKIAPYAQQHLKTMKFDDPLAKDIRELLQNAGLLETPSQNRQKPEAE